MTIKPSHSSWPARKRREHRPHIKVRNDASASRLFRHRRAGNSAVADKQIQRWADDGGAFPAEPPPSDRNIPPVWPPSALHARLSVEQALSDLPRRRTGISAEAEATLAAIVADVEQRTLEPEAAADQLRELTARLLLYIHTRNATSG